MIDLATFYRIWALIVSALLVIFIIYETWP